MQRSPTKLSVFSFLNKTNAYKAHGSGHATPEGALNFLCNGDDRDFESLGGSQKGLTTENIYLFNILCKMQISAQVRQGFHSVRDCQTLVVN